jgi:hypothetical protein
LPALLDAAELVVHKRMRSVLGSFSTAADPERSGARFDAIVASALRLRNSIARRSC